MALAFPLGLFGDALVGCPLLKLPVVVPLMAATWRASTSMGVGVELEDVEHMVVKVLLERNYFSTVLFVMLNVVRLPAWSCRCR